MGSTDIFLNDRTTLWPVISWLIQSADLILWKVLQKMGAGESVYTCGDE